MTVKLPMFQGHAIIRCLIYLIFTVLYVIKPTEVHDAQYVDEA